MISEYAVMVAGSMLSVLSSPESIKKIDERLFEGLLMECLNVLPELDAKLGVQPRSAGSTYSLGGRGYPDIVRFSRDGIYEVGIEVKLRSQHNLQHKNSPDARWQLDVYADNSERLTELILVTPDTRQTKLNLEFDRYTDPLFHNRGRWAFARTEELRTNIAELVGESVDASNPGIKLVTRLARLSHE